MNTIAFPALQRRFIAMAASLVAVVVFGIYISGITAGPSIAASYSAAARPLIKGVVKDSNGKLLAGAHATVKFKRNGRTLKTFTRTSNVLGRFSVPVPRSLLKARAADGSSSSGLVAAIKVAFGAQVANTTVGILAGKSVKITVVFPAFGSGLPPTIFPY